MPSPASTAVRRFHARADASTKTGEIWLYDLIGQTMWSDGISAKDVASAIKQCEAGGAEALSIFINSDGGSVSEGVSIHSVLSRFQGKKTVYVDGMAASIASLIAMAGDKICISPAAMMMIHDPAAGMRGNSQVLRKTADALDEMRDAMVEAYTRRTGKDADTIKAMMAAETWMKSTTCVNLGFADEVVQTAAPADAALAQMAIAARAPSLILASYQNLPDELKQQLFAQHPHLSQSPQSRAPARVPPKPRASAGNSKGAPAMETEILEAQERAGKALALAHKTEVDSITARLNVALGERESITSQLATAQSQLSTANATIKSGDAVIAAFRADAQEIFALTSKTTLAEARGVIAAYKQEASEAKELRAQALAIKEQTAKDSFIALVDKGITEGKITPAEAEKLKATPVAEIPTAKAFVETYFMARAPIVKVAPTDAPKPAAATAEVAGMDEATANLLRAAGMDPAKVAASTKSGDVPPVS